mmetsp:Transcript_80272/g.186413  ORF Transcript_80272/g.186413 Transcript_80272/m.186413 type:complete len:286 (-) Transcript_80272:78-935(-)
MAGLLVGVGGNYVLVLNLIIQYTVICCLASFWLGPGAFLVSFVLLLVQLLLAAETADLRHPSAPWLFVVWLVTAIAALLVGGRNYHASFAPYLTANTGQRYVQVPAVAPASAYADAGVLSFEEGAAVDDTRSIGLRLFGRTYCAAPILDPQNPPEKVQFWAVGLDCCSSRGSFTCDNVGDLGVRGGVVLHGPEEGYEALTRRVFAPRIFHEGYVRAIEASSLLFQLPSSESPVLLRWTADPGGIQQGWLRSTVLVWLLSSFLYGVVVCAWLVVLASCSPRRRAKH